MTAPEKNTSKARPVVYAVCVAQAAVAEVGGSVEKAAALVRSLRDDAVNAGDWQRADLAARAMAVLRFAANPAACPSAPPTALVLESLAEAKRRPAKKPLHIV